MDIEKNMLYKFIMMLVRTLIGVLVVLIISSIFANITLNRARVEAKKLQRDVDNTFNTINTIYNTNNN